MNYPYLYDMVIIVFWLLLPVTVGGFCVPVFAQTFGQMIIGLAGCIAANIFWLIGLAWFTELDFNTDLGVAASVIICDLAPFLMTGLIIRAIDGPYKPYRHPSDPLNRYGAVQQQFKP